MFSNIDPEFRQIPEEAHAPGSKLIIDCYDWDDMSANDHIGILAFDISHIPGNYTVTSRWFPLHCKDTDDAKVSFFSFFFLSQGSASEIFGFIPFTRGNFLFSRGSE